MIIFIYDVYVCCILSVIMNLILINVYIHTICYIDQYVFALVCRKDITCPSKYVLSVAYIHVSF